MQPFLFRDSVSVFEGKKIKKLPEPFQSLFFRYAVVQHAQNPHSYRSGCSNGGEWRK
jgi:hypothetical protein